MIKDIKGLHHVTSMAADANINNAFFTQVLGLRRVKQTVNFDNPYVYHLYYGDEHGTPGSVMTYFPFPDLAKGQRGTGEVGATEFAIPSGSMPFWRDRLASLKIDGLTEAHAFGEHRLAFNGPDSDAFALVESDRFDRQAWTGNGIGDDVGVLGFRGARFCMQDPAPTAELLSFMGYQKAESQGDISRFVIEGGNAADAIDLQHAPTASQADQGAGSVHHIAFAVEDRAAQLRVRNALLDTGYQVTPVIDRNYFWAIYFRTPGGVLFEIATNEPGFDHDEDTANLGQSLKLPNRYEPDREIIEANLVDLAD